ncbi:MAG: IS200/IS605 family transposase [Eubacteriaceae bacterium]|nr:IS200/IS605 family transposase [Eubacteriaceae bacterium]
MYKRKSHSKYSLKAHIILVVKYRKELLTPDVSFFVKTKFKQIEKRSGFRIELMETDKDHIHLLVDYDPKLSLLSIIRRLKQESTVAL